ncbi:MAG: hypothetical protein ACRD0O_12775 [Acidimicrobiia bacterium]
MRSIMKSGVGAAAVLVVVLTGSAVLPVGAQGGTEVIAIHVFGTADSEPTAPGAVAYTVDVFDIKSGEQIGRLHDEITCSSTTPPPCLVFDVVTTMRLTGGGEIVNHAQWSGVPDPQHPGHLLVGSRPGTRTAKGTAGDYAGRVVQWEGSGMADMRSFPARLGYDIFSVVTVS